jgi:hypothetical protein
MDSSKDLLNEDCCAEILLGRCSSANRLSLADEI